MLPFSASVALLGEHGIPVAPHHLIADGAEITLPEFGAPYVVKLADVAHRTEHGAVKLGITSQGLPAAVAELREIAAAEHLAPLVVVQPMVASRGEAFLGIQNTELGPMVVFGLGGIFVEVLKRVGGRMAPYTRAEAESLIAEFEGDKLMHGFRGLPPWPLDALADLLVSVGQLAAGSADWLQSLDVNPLLVTDDGFLAVDVLALVRDAGA
jgi:succinyl-CoA synthetase beta subunit